jgi:signal peptidase II
MKLKLNHILFFFLHVPILMLIDFVSKRFMVYYKPHTFLLNYTENTGAIFGNFQGYNLLFVIISILVLLALFYIYKKEKQYRTSWVLMIAGIAGNLLDRLLYGHVVDFIDLKYWYIFNLADVFIVLGVVLLIYNMMKSERDKRTTKSKKK